MTEERKRYLTIAIAEHNDQAAFDELFSFYFPGLVSFADSMLKDRQHAEEVVEDVFVKLWINRKTLVAIKNISHYIYAATKYATINALKTRKPVFYDNFGDDILLTYKSPETHFISNENISLITQAVNELPPKCRLVFRLIKEEGLKYDEVARLLHLSVKTVESQMTIAIKKLTATLKIMLPELSDNILHKKA
ncbi:MAG: RNA polymerase sigma-70 factor [Niabella sp.]